MGESLQDVYAKNLPKDYGYPLRTPEPSNTLPESYQNDGLHVGDVGYVDDYGRFQVLFNLHHSSQHDLHRKRGVPVNFEPVELDPEEVDIVRNAIPPKQVIRPPHLKQHLQPSEERVQYEFVASSAGAGAILILPFGAVRHDLKEKEEYRKIASEQAHHWCTFARRNSLYLLTGFHKARSWSLASFHNAERAGRIRVIRKVGEPNNVGIYDWEHTFPLDRRDGPAVDENGDENQTVFISGFKIEVRWWAQQPMIVWVPQSQGIWFTLYLNLCWFVSLLFSLVNTLWWRFTLKSFEHVPKLSQPFHPSDAINRYLLEKNPDASVAITHDTQWINMLDQEELSYEDLVQEGRLREILSEKYISVADDNAVYLRVPQSNLNCIDREDTKIPYDSPQEFQGFSLPTSRDGNELLVITHIRAENIVTPPGHAPVGFNVVARFDGMGQRTRSKPIPLHDDIIEWEDEILISSNSNVKIQFSLCGCFEFDPTLGNGEILYTYEICAEELIGNTYLIMLTHKETDLAPSLLLTLERRRFNYFVAEDRYDAKLECPSSLVVATDHGHEALLRYYTSKRKEDLQISIDQFEHALGLCPPTHDYRTPALFNLATAKFANAQDYGTHSDLNVAISLYREALDSRSLHHPDRPATLLRLAQALLHRYSVEGYDESVASEIEQLVRELWTIHLGDCHERRAADLVLQTMKRLRVVHSYLPDGLDGLILELERATRLTPEDYFDRPDRLENLRVALLARSQLVRDPSDADKAILILQEAVNLTPDDHPHKHAYLINLGNSFLARFNVFGDVGDLEQAVASHEDGVRLTPEYLPDFASHLCDLGISLRNLFEQLGDLDDINSAVARQECAVKLTSDDHPDYARRLHNLALSLNSRFERLKDLADIVSAIEKQEDAVRLTPKHHPQLTSRLSDLGVSLRIRFEQRGGLEDVDRAISSQEEAIRLSPEGDPERPLFLNNLALSLKARFDLVGDSAGITQAIAMHEDALRIIAQDHPLRPCLLHDLGVSLETRFDRSGDLEDLTLAIARLEEAVQLTPRNHLRRGLHMNSLSLAFCSYFRRLGHLIDLERAIEMQEEALKLIPHDHPAYPHHLNSSGNLYWTRFRRLANVSDIEQAIKRQGDAVELTPPSHPNYATYLNDLGLSFLARFGQLGDTHDLEQAIERHEEIMQLTPATHSHRPRHLNSLGLSYWARFSRLGNVSDIEQSIKFQTEAIELTPDDHPNRTAYRNDLALSLRSRFDRLGNLPDLEQAIEIWEDVVNATPLDHPLRPYYLSNLGPCFHARFIRVGVHDDLDQAIKMEKDATDLTPDDHPDRARLLNNLSHSLMTRFDQRGDINDLEQAIHTQQEVVQLTPERNPYRAVFLSSLGHFFKARFEKLGIVDDIERAVEAVQGALDITPPDDPEYGHREENLHIFRRVHYAKNSRERSL